MTPADELLEEQIGAAYALGITAADPDVQRNAFATMVELVAQRSSERVREMEVERGLRAP